MAKPAKDKDNSGKSTLDAAFRAFDNGDEVTARRLAKTVIMAPTPEDQAAVKRVAKALLGDDPGDPHAETLAGEIVRRTQPILMPYRGFIEGAAAYLA